MVSNRWNVRAVLQMMIAGSWLAVPPANAEFSWPAPGTIVTTRPADAAAHGDDQSAPDDDPSPDQDDEQSNLQLIPPAGPAIILAPQPEAPGAKTGNGQPSANATSTADQPVAQREMAQRETAQREMLPADSASRVMEDPVDEMPSVRDDQPSPRHRRFTVDPLAEPSDELVADGLPSNQLRFPQFSVMRRCLQSGLFWGGEATFLAPSRESRQSVSMTNLLTDTRFSESIETGLAGGGRGWIGLRSGNTGFLATGWHLDQHQTNLPGPFFAKEALAMASSYRFSATTVDLELFQDFCFPLSTVRATLGGRYARMQRRGLASGFGELGGANVHALSHGATEMSGWGLTASLAGQRPICWLDHCGDQHRGIRSRPHWSLLWAVRGAVLASQAEASAHTEAQVSGDQAVAQSIDGAIGAWDGTTVHGQLQLGLQYARPLACFPANMIIASGFEGHLWQTGKVAAESESVAFLAGSPPDFGAQALARSTANGRDIALAGFFFRVALER